MGWWSMVCIKIWITNYHLIPRQRWKNLKIVTFIWIKVRFFQFSISVLLESAYFKWLANNQIYFLLHFSDPSDCLSRSNDFYSNVPLNIEWINSQINLPSTRTTSGGLVTEATTEVSRRAPYDEARSGGLVCEKHLVVSWLLFLFNIVQSF